MLNFENKNSDTSAPKAIIYNPDKLISLATEREVNPRDAGRIPNWKFYEKEKKYLDFLRGRTKKKKEIT